MLFSERSAGKANERLSTRSWLIVAALLGTIAAGLSPASWEYLPRAILGWNTAIIIWLTAVVWSLRRAGPHQLARYAGRYDVGWIISLAIVSAAALASLVAILHLLSGVKNLSTAEKAPHMLGSVATITSSWIALHTLYALHYAHRYYARSPSGGLAFPGGQDPIFSDFVYFSFTIGATSQTSDTAITSSAMRRAVTVHAALSFVFNTAVLALTVNIAAGIL